MSKNHHAIKISRFNLNEVHDNAVCIFLGKRRSGKSWAIRDLMYHKRQIPIGHIVSGTEKANPFFYKFFPYSYISEEYDEELLENIIRRQIKIKHFACIGETSNSREIDPRFMLVFDDCLHDNKWQSAKSIKNVFMNGRHFNICFLLSMQYVIGIPPNLRTNVDYVFVYRDYSPTNRKKIYQNYGASIPSYQVFCSLMDNLDAYECLVISTDPALTTFQEQVKYFKAKPREHFLFGSTDFWNQHSKIMKLRHQYTKIENKNGYDIIKHVAKK